MLASGGDKTSMRVGSGATPSSGDQGSDEFGIRSRFSVASAIRSARLMDPVVKTHDAKARTDDCHDRRLYSGELREQPLQWLDHVAQISLGRIVQQGGQGQTRGTSSATIRLCWATE